VSPTPSLLIIGAGGHARVVIEAARAAGYLIAGLIAPGDVGTLVLGAAILGDDDALPRLRADGLTHAVVALGDNALRGRVLAKLRTIGFVRPSIVHPTAWLSPSSQLADGCVVLQQAAISAAATISEGCIINSGAIVEHDCDIGEAAHIAPGCALAGRVQVGARTLVGVGSAVRPGIVIGADVIIGAGSAVVTDIADGAVVGGSPARALRRGAMP
jgi:UDP-perosamine 4-acetyltransferase